MAERSEKISRLIRLYGIVQGVGFRPFVARTAELCRITGSVANKGSYVEIRARGTEEQLASFLHHLSADPPPRSVVLETEVRDDEAREYDGFSIIESRHEPGDIFVSPDIGVCPECRKELFDSSDRRYLHPFINCTACGPRLTILDAMPYDRERTSMKVFPMCPACSSEYHDPASRRYDAQPVCCSDCGPEVYLAGRSERGAEAITLVRRALMAGRIAAVKGIGGFHLCCDARNPAAVERLRLLKHRPVKPFALMMRDLETVRKECELPSGAEELIDSWRKPIVLLPRRPDSALPDSVAPGNPFIGAMLPYAPLQLLLFTYPDGVEMTDVLVMTSGNVSGAPICRNDEEAQEQIGAFCDLILSHDRRIRLRADDSVVDFSGDRPCMVRRSRGYAPLPFRLPGFRGQVLGIGGELKNTFCPAKDELFYPSPYLGDLADVRTVRALEESVARLDSLLEIRPELVACDLHPRYNSSALAEKLGVPVLKVQHHYAHVLSCMAENGRLDPVIGVSFDGTGYGADGTIWGGEFLRAEPGGFTRLGSTAPFAQAGGDVSSRQGWRIAASLAGAPEDPETRSLLSALIPEKKPQEWQFQLKMIEKKLNCVLSTSAGRLFDAAAALLGLCTESTFEGEGAMKLEFAALAYLREHTGEPEPLPLAPFAPREGELFRLNTTALVRRLARARLAGAGAELLAWQFHATLASFITAGVRRCREVTDLECCALTGGVFQNALLTELVSRELERAGFEVLRHREVPPNDGGIALGQALAAMYMIDSTRR